MPEPRMAYISQIDGYLKMLFEIAARTSFQQYCEDLAETKFKINVYLHGENWRRENETSEKEIAKAVREKSV